ncbi:hypothetical protein KGF56_003910 [Candida oxycetoniae]|uniref:Ribosomal protein L19 n=1 Tax=Candida oxycetoniae TaxID=497107 RepID=A0AAI9WWL8_9ASCO|nr:uncharacterized protein KGF56_003910 [Candida oxycetoniae]KAI3403322.1 hypothetical protein KGF56_003910 [Candida oxycetoniae]
MLKSVTRPVKVTSNLLQPFRAFHYLRKKLPTVYEPLPPRRNGENVMTYIHRELVKKHDPTGKRSKLIDYKRGLRAGDIIKVTYLDRSDLTGRVIAIKRGQLNLGSNILLRTKLNKVGSEIRVPIFNPNIRNVEVLYKPKEYLPRRAQYYIRGTRYDIDDAEAFVKRQYAEKKEKEVKTTEKTTEKTRRRRK